MKAGVIGAAILVVAACGPGPAAVVSPATPGPVPTVAAHPSGSPRATPAVTGSTSPEPAILPGERWLAFQSDVDGPYGIRLVRPDGSDLFFPTRDVPGSEQLHPEWSPDGERLVFSTQGPVTRDLWITDADGANPHQAVTCDDCIQADEPAWSPDGSTIAFHRQARVDRAWVSTLELLDVATGASRVVTTAAPDRAFYGPRWSPDGTRLVVELVHRTPGSTDREDYDFSQLAIVDLTTATPKPEPITGRGTWSVNPDWDASGERIVFVRPIDPADFESPTNLWTMRPDGTEATPITRFAEVGGWAAHSTFTPDGARVVFIGGRTAGGPEETLTVAVDGSDVRPATATGVGGAHPRFRPTP